MKKIIIMLSLALISWGANAQHDHSKMGHSGIDSKMMGKSGTSTSFEVEHSKSTTSIIDNYIALKDALSEDNSDKAASSGKMLFDAFAKFDLLAQSETQQKELAEIIEDASEHAEHISDNKGHIDHQREHFEILSTDIKDLVQISGSDRNLYQIYCPMYNDGARWLSESNEVKNPFFGNKMLKCGKVELEITVK